MSCAILLLGVLLSTKEALANHIAGASYTGTVEGGGTISFTVSSDGLRIDGFTAAAVPGEAEVTGTAVDVPCALPTATLGAIAVVNHGFSQTNTRSGAVLVTVDATFLPRGRARGSLRISRGTECETGNLDWTALTLAATPAPTDTAAPTATPLSRDVSAGCLDFRTQAEAQAFFRSHTGDPFGLDTDGDGIACEGLTTGTGVTAGGGTLPRTGVKAPVYGFTGLGLLFAGLALVTFTGGRLRAPAGRSPSPTEAEQPTRLPVMASLPTLQARFGRL